MRQSIRVRLTIWYATVTLVALVIMAAAVWALFRHSVVQAAEDRLTAQVQGIKRFTATLESDVSLDVAREEYGEYSDMSRGNAVFELATGSGDVLVGPDMPGWTPAIAALTDQPATTGDIVIGAEPYRASTTEFTDRGRRFRVVVAVPLGPSLDALSASRRLLFWMLPIMTIVAAACGYLVSGRALRPVDVMAQAAREIHVGNLARRLDEPATDDELRRLAVTFNGMLSRLEAGVSNIARFTSEASHELRTPVAIVRTTAELALRHDRKADEYRRALSDIHAQAAQMSDLVDDLLTVARADAGVETQPDTDVDLRSAASASVERWRREGTSPAPAIEWVRRDARVVVRADARQIRRLLDILCDNALKYTPVGGRVQVDVCEAAAHATLVVEDDGIGIAMEDRSRVFERFYRGPQAREYASAGSGLGLAIARAIVDRHGGSIEIESPIHASRERPGTRITVSLPLTGPSDEASLP